MAFSSLSQLETTHGSDHKTGFSNWFSPSLITGPMSHYSQLTATTYNSITMEAYRLFSLLNYFLLWAAQRETWDRFSLRIQMKNYKERLTCLDVKTGMTDFILHPFTWKCTLIVQQRTAISRSSLKLQYWLAGCKAPENITTAMHCHLSKSSVSSRPQPPNNHCTHLSHHFFSS